MNEALWKACEAGKLDDVKAMFDGKGKDKDNLPDPNWAHPTQPPPTALPSTAALSPRLETRPAVWSDLKRKQETGQPNLIPRP